MHFAHRGGAIALALLAILSPAMADAAVKPAARPASRLAPAPTPLLAVTLGTGAQYQSNVSVDEADFNTRQGDQGLLLSASARLTPLSTRKTTISVGYAFDDTINRDLTDFNLALHTVSASATHRVGKAVLAADGQYTRVVLGSRRYLDIAMVSPSVSAFVAPRLFVRGAATWTRKDFTTADRLDAETLTLAADAYRFFAKRKAYIAVGLRGDDESAKDRAFSFRAAQASLRGQVPLRLAGTDIKARLGYAWQVRDYRAPTLSIGADRHENRSTITGSLDIGLAKGLTLRPQLRYVDRRSNVAIYHYKEHTVATMLLWKI